MGASVSVWEEIKRKTNAKGGNPASPRNPKHQSDRLLERRNLASGRRLSC
jgi:hypothetical protein